MNRIIDIHTHNTAHPAQSLLSTMPATFKPKPGKYYSLGIHPWHTHALHIQHEWESLEELCHHSSVVAIGETGLDTLRGAPLNKQEELLARHIHLARAMGKPLIIHCVRASQQLIKLCRETGAHDVNMAVHGFRGNENVAQALINEGFYLSFGEHFNPRALLITPPHRILLETDESLMPIEQIAAQVAQAMAATTRQIIDLAASNAATFLIGNIS